MNQFRTLFYAIFFFSLISCGSSNSDDMFLETISDIEISSSVSIFPSEEISLHTKGNGAVLKSFNKTLTLDLASADELEEYLNKIEDVDIQQVSVTVQLESGSGTIESLIVLLSDAELVYTIYDVPLDSSIQLEMSSQDLSSVSDLMKSDMVLEINFSGYAQLESEPLSFRIISLTIADVEVNLI